MGANSQSGCILQIFAENCIKMKEFGPEGASLVPPWIRQCPCLFIFVLSFLLSCTGWTEIHTDSGKLSLSVASGSPQIPVRSRAQIDEFDILSNSLNKTM